MGRFSFIYLFTLTPVWGGVEAVLHYVFLPTVMAPWVIGRVGRPAWKVSHLRIANRTVLDEIISASFLVFFTAEAWLGVWRPRSAPKLPDDFVEHG